MSQTRSVVGQPRSGMVPSAAFTVMLLFHQPSGGYRKGICNSGCHKNVDCDLQRREGTLDFWCDLKELNPEGIYAARALLYSAPWIGLPRAPRGISGYHPAHARRRVVEIASQVSQSKSSSSSQEKIALSFPSLSPFQENRYVRFAWSYPPASCWEEQMKTALPYILLLYPHTSGILIFFLTWPSSLFHFFAFIHWRPFGSPPKDQRRKAR